MAEKQPRPLAEMQAAADRLVEQLRPYCDRLEIAGSIRRRKPACSDIELLAVPKFRMELVGLFDKAWVNELDEYAQQQIDVGRWQHRLSVIGRPAFGERYKRIAVDGIALDLFSVLPPAQWGVLWLVRTGPADFSHRLVSNVGIGGWLPNGWRVKDGGLYRDEVLVETPEEADVFRLLGREFVPPEVRA